MATIVSCNAIEKKLEKAGLPIFPHDKMTDWLASQAVEVSAFFAYLTALEAGSPVNDQNIPGCPAAQADKLTGLFKSKGHIIAK